MRVAVVGAGVFGCTAAIELVWAGHTVVLYERHGGILLGGSRANCARIHRGYHYPRSEPTARATLAAAGEVEATFAAAVSRAARHYYCVARDSLVGGDEYLAFLDRLGLPYDMARPPPVRADTVELTIRAHEATIHIGRLRMLLSRRLEAAGVDLRSHAAAGPDMRGYDLTVLATYGRHAARPLQFEVTEVALVRLGHQFAEHSYVVLDGPFACLDPLPGTDTHMLYDVTHSVHHRNVGMAPEIPDHLVPLVDSGRHHTGYTHVDAMARTARRFLGVGTPEYRGSLFTVRAVLPDVTDTDARPTLVERDGNTVRVLSGKLDTAVTAARRVVALAAEAVPV